jgi:hypothetical protein
MFAKHNTHDEELILIYIITEHNYTTLHAVKSQHIYVLNIVLTKIFYSPTNTMGTCGI